MKIALLSPISWPIPALNYGPWEKVVYTLAQGLVEKGHNVTVFATKDTKGNFKVDYVIEKTLAEDNEFSSEKESYHIVESIKKIQQGKFDLVNNHLWYKAQLYLELSGLKYVTTLHGNLPESNYIFDKYRNANYVSISKSLQNANPYLNYLGNVYNGIDFKEFNLVEDKSDYFVSTSRIHPDKGIVEAIELAKKTNRRLFLAGLVHDQKYFDEEVKNLIDNDQIIYLGNIPQKDIQLLVSKAYATLSLINWEEPFGLSVAESIACGTPVIATKRGSMSELVSDRVSGLLVDNVNEAIERIDEIKKIDPVKCREYGENLFSIEQMIDGYIEVFEKVIS